MPAIRFDVVLSTTDTYRTDGVVKHFYGLKNSEIKEMRRNCPEGRYVLCTGWSNPNPGTWVVD